MSFKSLLMNLRIFEPNEEKEIEDSQAFSKKQEVSERLYLELFKCSDFLVKAKPWEELSSDSKQLFLFKDSGLVWRAALRSAGNPALVLSQVSPSPSESDCRACVELQVIASDFLQGHDYELNVRYAPESWDHEERDVIVLRGGDSEETLGPVTENEVILMIRVLELWSKTYSKSTQLDSICEVAG